MPDAKAMAVDLFSPFLADGRVDKRLLQALGIPADDYAGQFDKIPDPAEGTAFDFYMEAKSGRSFFFDLKLSEAAFGSCPDNAPHRQKAERHLLPHLRELVDTRWLVPEAFFANHELLAKLSYLGRYPDSGLVFIFPRANEPLKETDETIKKMVSKKLAPRVALLYLEYVVARILTLVDDDAALRGHFLDFRSKYAGEHALHSPAKEP